MFTGPHWSNTVTHFMPFEAQMHLRIAPHDHFNPRVHPSLPPPIMPSQCMVRCRIGIGATMGCVACNYRSLQGQWL